MTVAVLSLVAKNIKDFRVLAGFNEAITAVCIQAEPNVFTYGYVFDSKLLFKLPECKSRDSNPTIR